MIQQTALKIINSFKDLSEWIRNGFAFKLMSNSNFFSFIFSFRFFFVFSMERTIASFGRVCIRRISNNSRREHKYAVLQIVMLNIFASHLIFVLVFFWLLLFTSNTHTYIFSSQLRSTLLMLLRALPIFLLS